MMLLWRLFLLHIPVCYGDVGYFWHITDFHYDFTYHDRQLSCNPDNTPADPGQFGDFWCDSPWLLVNNSIRAMHDLKADVDFILWTGDTVLHTGNDNLNYSINAGILDDCTAVLKNVFSGTTVYASFGNHDYFPNNQFPSVNNLLYNDTLNRWKDWIADAGQHENFRNGAYYTVTTAHGLRLIALNTNLYYTSNKAVAGISDPGDQFQFLNKTLSDALTNQEKVLITAHIPPGVHTPNGRLWMYPEYNDKLVDLLQQYADIIVGMHFGHDHADGFKIMPNSKDICADYSHLDIKISEPKAPIFIAPSVTPWRYKIPSETGPAHNPGIRLIKYDRQSGVHLDIHQYYLDLQKANQNGVATWQLEYKTSVDYGLNELTGAKLHNLAGKMKNSNGNEFKNYWKFYTVSPPDNLTESCDDACHASVVCGFSKYKMDDFTSCKTEMISSGYSVTASSYIVVIVYQIILFYI